MAQDDEMDERAQLAKEFEDFSLQITTSVEDGSYNIIDDITLMNAIYYIWAHWIDFHIYVLSPILEPQLPAIIIPPGTDPKTKKPEHVYPIFDYGNRLSASVGPHLASGTRSTGKMLNTVKKMIKLLLEKVKEGTGVQELTPETEIQLAFDGHELSQRMAFKDCIMRPEHLVITNFEPGAWGELQLRTMEELARKGYLPGM